MIVKKMTQKIEEWYFLIQEQSQRIANFSILLTPEAND